MKELLWELPVWVDRWRLWPRAMITAYLWIVIEVSLWFMGLPSPTAVQAGFASSVLGIGAGWFALYIRKPDARQ